jgi:hypothetical protein
MNENQNQMEMSIFGVGPTGTRIFTVYHERIKKMNFVTDSTSRPQQKVSALYTFYYGIKKLILKNTICIISAIGNDEKHKSQLK